MKGSHKTLLVIDAVVNLFLGILLLLAPIGLIDILGLPAISNTFYTTVLAGVLVGIGIALLLSLRCNDGLGLLGAIVINLCGSSALAAWLLINPDQVSKQGSIILAGIVILVLGLGLLELYARLRSAH